MFNLTDKKETPIGLYISDVSMKFVQFRRNASGLTVAAYSDLNIPKEVMSGDAIKKPKVLVELIRRAVAQPIFGKVILPHVIASIPETKSFVRVIQMPKMSEEEAVEAVPWEAEAYIPLPIEQVYLDWIILSKSLSPVSKKQIEGESKGEKMTVLITAAPKEYIDDLVNILKEAGLVPLGLEVESQAIARSLVSRINEAVLIADINTIRTSLSIYDKGILQFTSSLPIAGNLMTEKLAEALNITKEEAEKLKRENGLAEDVMQGKIKRALTPVLENFVEEIKNTIRFYEEHALSDGKIARFVLTGGSGRLKHLPSFIHDRLTHSLDGEHPLRSLPGIKVELGNPWVNVLSKGQTPILSREESLSYATAIGLALRGYE